MSGSQKGGAYARALARELPLEHGDLRAIRFATRTPSSRSRGRMMSVFGRFALDSSARDPLGTIAVRQSIREDGRKNFTLAHEIAHFLLPDHDQTELVCTKSDIGNWGDWSRELEREADEFAAELLLPASAVQPIVESAPPSLQVIEKIAQRFHTSFRQRRGGTAIWRSKAARSCGPRMTESIVGRNARATLLSAPKGAPPSARHVCVAMLCGNT